MGDEGIIEAFSILTNPDFFKFYKADEPYFRQTHAYKVGLVDDQMKITKKKKDLTKDEKDILKVSYQKRISYICDQLTLIFDKYLFDNTCVVIEDISLGSSGAIVDLARLLGAIERTCQLNEVKHALFRPTTIKKFAGKGNFGKEEMIAVVPEEDRAILEAACPVNTRNEIQGLDNLADSYHIARFCRHHFGS